MLTDEEGRMIGEVHCEERLKMDYLTTITGSRPNLLNKKPFHLEVQLMAGHVHKPVAIQI